MGLSFVSYTISSKDVPGSWSLVVFLPGCNFRCRHCHNWKLATGEEKPSVFEREILSEVSSNPVIDTLVISGGEPTVHNTRKLIAFVERVKKRRPDIKVRIDTNGYNPSALRELKEVVDGFAVDVKSPFSKASLYEHTTGVMGLDLSRILRSMELADDMLMTIYRTPKYPWLSEGDLKEIEDFVGRFGSPWFLNEFVEVPSCPFNL